MVPSSWAGKPVTVLCASQVNPAVPGPLSEIILHLLEKEPDRRYQTADGLAYDLEQLRDAAEREGAAHALALAKLIAGEKLPVRLHLLIPAVENAISADAFRPGDVLRSRFDVKESTL